MPNLHITVRNKEAAPIGAPLIICGNSDYTIDFDFDAEWDALAIKTARFVWVEDHKVKYTDVVFGEEPCQVPILSNTREVRVGVFAGELHTTTPAVIPCQRSILCGTGQTEADPITPSQYDQVMALLNAEGVGYLAGAKQNKLGWLTEADLDAMWAGTYAGEEDEDREGTYFVYPDAEGVAF